MREKAWWVHGTQSGRRIILGPCRSESDALGRGNDIHDWDSMFETIQLPTIDMATAKSMIKAELSKKYGSIGLSMRPIRKSKDNRMEIQRGMY